VAALIHGGEKRRPRQPALLIWKRPQGDPPGAVSFLTSFSAFKSSSGNSIGCLLPRHVQRLPSTQPIRRSP